MVVVGTSLREALADTLVGILQVILSDESDVYFLCSVLAALEEGTPGTESRFLADGLTNLAQDGRVEALVLHVHRHLIDAGQVFALDDAVEIDVTESSHLFANLVRQMLLSAEHEDVGLDTDALQFLDGVLCRLCLQLAGSLEVGHISKVYADSALAEFPFQLTDCLHERCTLDVTDGTTDLRDDEVIVVLLPEELDIALDLVGDMWHHLDGLAQIVTATLLVDDALIDASCCQGVGFGSLNACESLIVSKVEVSLHAVNGYIAFTVLIGIERSWVDVDVRVKFLDGDVVASCL